MHLMYFTEQPMSTFPADAVGPERNVALTFSNRYFDAAEGSRLYRERITEYQLAEEVGFDGIMLNEHHNTVTCMQPQITIMATVLAVATERVKIVLLGTPLPTIENPVAVAEMLAMVDMISKGRLVAGIVRGSGAEQFANNVNPALNRDRFQEAHDLIIKTWTEPGPWRWEGDNYQFRLVNPWALPLQKPHPRIWVPGVASPETIVWCAERGYPYIALNTSLDQTEGIWKLYNDVAERSGYEAGPEHRGYLLRIHVQDTEEKAFEGARQFRWMADRDFVFSTHPVWSSPTGYVSPERRQWHVQFNNGRTAMTHTGARPSSFEQELEQMRIIAGTPDQVVSKMRILIEKLGRPGILSLWANDGRVSHADSKRCIELLGREVLPALREFGSEQGLVDPFEVDAPVSRQFGVSPTVPVAASA